MSDLPEPVMRKTMWGDLFTTTQLAQARKQGAEEVRVGHGKWIEELESMVNARQQRISNLQDIVESQLRTIKALKDCDDPTLTVIKQLDAKDNRIAGLDAALKEWLDKTEWVQQGAASKELGMHRADVLKQRIAELEQKNAQLLEALEYMLTNYVPFVYRNDTKVLFARAAIAAAEVKE